MCKKFLPGLLIFWMQSLHAQQNFSDSVPGSLAEETKFAKNIYSLQKGNQAAIFNGTIHISYSSEIEGIAYFFSVDWQKGNVLYGDIYYENILMKYDMVKDQLIVKAKESEGQAITLFSPRVKQFSFLDSKFIRVDNATAGSFLQAGFYRQLTHGKVTALARATKTISEKITDNKVARKFEEKIKYYTLKDSRYSLIENKNNLLSILKERKKELQGFIKENKLNFRKDMENAIVSVVEFYNHLKG